MTTWQELAGYVRSNYKITDEQPDIIKLIFETANLRSQVVILGRQNLLDGEEEWLQIMSPIADLASVNLQGALEAVGDVVCGGLAIVGELLVLRHAVPLLNLNINEFERPLVLVTMTADRLEHELAGGDKY
jgi:hypothetical protein